MFLWTREFFATEESSGLKIGHRIYRTKTRPIFTIQPGYYSCSDNSGTRVQMHTFEISAIKLYQADCFELCALLLANRRRQKLKLPKLCTPDRLCIIVIPSFKYLCINPHSTQIKIHARYLSSCPILMVRVDLLRNNKAIILLLWNISTIIV